jgi:superfamily II DNA or RNA helicase
MNNLPDTVKFKYPWRDYQQRVLDELEAYLHDRKLHVIAPPGSGKTILGLEVVRRLNCPTLILSPTLAIRDQWKDRFVDLFLCDSKDAVDWISLNIHEPGFLTSSTYQALHCDISGKSEAPEEDEEEGTNNHDNDQAEETNNEAGGSHLIDILKTAGIKVLVVDECHHLKNAWWKSLMLLKDSLGDLTIIALTATPPYDVSSAEWERYKEFCGPVDAEISVPELVRKGDLCPHQDFVYFSSPLREESSILNGFHEGIRKILDDLKKDIAFKETILQYPFICDADNYIENILDDPSFFASMLIYLHGIGADPDKSLFDILGSTEKDVPALTHEWFEILLTGLLFGDEDYYKEHKTCLASVETALRHCGAIERKTVTLVRSEKIGKLLTQSVGKLDSIVKIVDIERKALGQNLRLVVLTDFVRRTELGRSMDEENHRVKKLGVIPIFEALRAKYKDDLKIGVLCGTVVIIPKSALKSFRRTSRDCGIPARNIDCHELPGDPEFFIVEHDGSFKHEIVRVITKIFEQGEIQALVGTKSLLGEGWDSPSINALILASFVGSFVLSNQMRGRAIRSLVGNPDKVSNIWHLVCVDPFSASGGSDIETLTRRFSAFLGISNRQEVIEKGLDRLNFGNPPYSEAVIEGINTKMASIASDRAAVRHAWEVGLCKGTVLRELVKTPSEIIPKGFIFNRTIRAVFFQGLYASGYFLTTVLRSLRGVRLEQDMWEVLLVVFAIASVLALPNTVKSLFLYLRNGPIESAVRLISRALLESLQALKIIRTDSRKLKLVIEYDHQGSVFCLLDGATYFEASQFRTALLEILGPIDNPRYLITRNSPIFRFHRIDFHTVPDLVGGKKEHAERFLQIWKRRVGYSELIYTRSREGRRMLVKARGYALSSAFVKRSEVISHWR